MLKKDTVVVSYHSDTENDSNQVNNRFSADLYLIEIYFYFPLSGIYTPAVCLKTDVSIENNTNHELSKPEQYNSGVTA